MSALTPIETSVQNQHFSGAFSIGGGNRQNLQNNSDTPAPGCYDINLKGSLSKIPGPIWSKKKADIAIRESPSPASYNKPSEIGKGKVTISTSQFKDFRDNFRIGPLAYDNDTLKVKQKAPAYSLNSKPESLDYKFTYMSTPGPQKYELKPLSLKKSHNKKQTGFGSGDKNSIYKMDSVKNPGPGSYKFEKANKKTHISKFGKGKRLGTENPEQLKNPGAGAYDISGTLHSSMKQSHSQSMISQHSSTELNISKINKSPSQITIKQQLPGPGQYDLNRDFKHKKQPAYKIGASKRQDLVKNNRVPGPGSYGQIFNKQTSHADLDYFQGFGSNPRQTSLISDALGPGPGNYETHKYKSIDGYGKGAIISHGNPSLEKEGFQLPGPGQYNLNTEGSSRVNFGNSSILSSSKDIDQTQITNVSYIPKSTVPGPGTYDLRAQMAKPKFGYSFGTSRRMANGEEEAIFQTSPLTYNIKTNIGSIPEYLKGQRKNEI